MAYESKLSVDITSKKSITIINFSGTYDLPSLILMKEIMDALVRNHRLKLVVRLGMLKEIDEIAYKYLELIHREIYKRGGAIVLLCCYEDPKEICEQLKQRYGFLVFTSFEQARQYFIERGF